MVIDNKKKRNGGSSKDPAGVNTIKIINQTEDVPIGIPPCRYPEILAIAKELLLPEEYDYFRMHVGVCTPRLTQTEIAVLRGVTPNYVSRVFSQASEKLRRPKYKKRLNALVPTIDEINEALAAQDDRRDLADRLEKSSRVINGYKDSAVKAKAKIAELEKSLGEEKIQSATLRKQLTDMEAEVSKLKRQANTLSNENALLKIEVSRFKKNVDAFLLNCGFTAEEGFEITVHRLEELFDGDILAVLKRAGISTIDVLCDTTRKNLIDLRVSKEFVKIIEEKLKSIGLHLRET